MGLIAVSNPSDAANTGLAKQLINPLAPVISVPFQLNHDMDFNGIGSPTVTAVFQTDND